MFADASALVAILVGEPERPLLLRALREGGRATTSALAVFETTSALVRKKAISVEAALREVEAFLSAAQVTVVPLGLEDGREALSAFARFGKGRGHPAQLNMGDCFAYACARTRDVPLLFIGDDFAQTDIPSALD